MSYNRYSMWRESPPEWRTYFTPDFIAGRFRRPLAGSKDRYLGWKLIISFADSRKSIRMTTLSRKLDASPKSRCLSGFYFLSFAEIMCVSYFPVNNLEINIFTLTFAMRGMYRETGASRSFFGMPDCISGPCPKRIFYLYYGLVYNKLCGGNGRGYLCYRHFQRRRWWRC